MGQAQGYDNQVVGMWDPALAAWFDVVISDHMISDAGVCRPWLLRYFGTATDTTVDEWTMCQGNETLVVQYSDI